MDIAGFAVAPRRQHFHGAVSHNLRVRRNPLAMKCRRGEPPLPEPGIAFVSEQSLTKKPAAVADDAVFQKILVVPDQNFFDEIGMIQKIYVQPCRAVIKNISEFARPGGENREWIGARQRHIANQKAWLRTWRTDGHTCEHQANCRLS